MPIWRLCEPYRFRPKEKRKEIGMRQRISKLRRHYSALTLKLLWGRAAGRCAMPDCRIELFAESTKHDPVVPLGEIAHAAASSVRGPRGTARLSVGRRDEYENLILLCGTCHKRIDRQKNSYTISDIRRIRDEHEAWVRQSLPARGRSRVGWSVIFLEGAHPIDKQLAILALTPDFDATRVAVSITATSRTGLDSIVGRLRSVIERQFRRGDPYDRRFAVFPLAPVSACIALGYLLTNRPRVKLFQYHREKQSWRWRPNNQGHERIRVEGLPELPTQAHGGVAICFHISAPVTREQVDEVNSRFVGRVDISIGDLGTGWLKEERQLIELMQTAREVFEQSAILFPRATLWHLFCAVPAPVAVAIGQQINPTMSPSVQLYEFDRTRRPCYQASILLGTSNNGGIDGRQRVPASHSGRAVAFR